ncbi:MAG: ATP-binding protein [Flavobacteriales bacterium]
MSKAAFFKVDPKLAELLGESYRSVEEAIKELVDNAYDADADSVRITIPGEMTDVPPSILIVDDGTGMKEQEVRREYLKIASSRFKRKGAKTALKKRAVKGKKGIGKFAGLMIADFMTLTTTSKGQRSTLLVNKPELAKAKFDLERVSLPLTVEECEKAHHGTTILLEGLNQNLFHPNPEALKQLLVRDYGRANEMAIYVNDEPIGVLDYQGASFTKELTLANGQKATAHYTITDKPVRNAGIVMRVGNNIIGHPVNLFKEDEVMPSKLQGRIVGEIVCDALVDDLTSDGAAVFDNSKLLNEVHTAAASEIAGDVDNVYKTDMRMARMRHKQRIDRALQQLPEFKRPFAEKALQKLLEKFYGESDERIGTLISVIIAALEKDYYWTVIEKMEEARDGDVEKFADALSEFGFLEISMVASQAVNRARFLDELDMLLAKEGTLEKTMHRALEKNLWVLGNEYAVVFSNRTLANALEQVSHKLYKGPDQANRPDLLLAETISRKYLLFEFKRPGIGVGRGDESQALEYRDALNTILHNQRIDIVIMGGHVKASIASHNERPDVRFMSYTEMISIARNNLSWLLEELKSESSSA